MPLPKLVASCLFVGLLVALHAAPPPPRERASFNDGWRFAKTDDAHWTAAQLDYAVAKPWMLASSAWLLSPLSPRPGRPAGNLGGELPQVQADFDDRGWQPVDLPHDWAIAGPFRQEHPGETGKLAWWGTGWYRKHFTLPKEDAARRIALEIDGAMSHSLVWLNGRLVGGWGYGYSSYRLDLTPYLRFGAENTLAVRLDNPPDSSRWYPGGGLYRNVWLTKTSPVHVAPWGVFVTTPRVSASDAVVSVSVVADNETDQDAELTVSNELLAADEAGSATGAAVLTSPTHAVKIPAGRQFSSTQMLTLTQPRLWSVATPQRYVVRTTLKRGEEIVDQCDTPFGIRTAVFDAQRGFLLNGERLPLRGVCLHHDLGALGSAINERAIERQLRLLRAMGCNAIRTSHNPPAPELLEWCDRLGFVVMDEVFDCWVKGKKRNDYHQLFADWHEQDLRAFIRRDRNHPSVVLWSIGNEVQDQHDAEGWKIGARLAGIVREEDRTRPLSCGLDGVASGYRGLQLVVDAMGYNYKPWEYARFHAAYPTIPIYGSETGSTVSSRGEYFFPLPDVKTDPRSRVDFQVSSYDLCAEAWSTTPETEWRGQDEGDYVAGEFVWTGFDYLGESTPYLLDSTDPLLFSTPERQAAAGKQRQELGRILVPSRSSYFGIIDLAGFPKDRFYLYQARWRPELPQVHVLPHWTWPERVGQVTPVHAYTSGDEAELFLNGRSLGRRKPAEHEPRVRWDDVRYEPGEVKVVAYKSGRVWAEETIRTASSAARLQATVERTALRGDSRDLAYVEVAITDERGVLVPRANHRVSFTVTGPVTWVASDNGDPTSHEAFPSPSRAAFNGRVLGIVRAQPNVSGKATVRVEAPGLAPAEVELILTPPATTR